jgi:hypothetical protein
VERNQILKLHPYPDHIFVVLHASERGKGGHVHLLELTRVRLRTATGSRRHQLGRWVRPIQGDTSLVGKSPGGRRGSVVADIVVGAGFVTISGRSCCKERAM